MYTLELLKNKSLVNAQTNELNFSQEVVESHSFDEKKDAKKKLIDPKFEHLNMLGIAYEVGFNSKATFFAVFKKMAGISPGAYKKRSLAITQ